MQINRLFEIIYILLDKKSVTAKELAERFEVSTRTIYRDIEILSSSGIPVYMVRGKGGGISLLSDFILNKAVFTDEERSDILSSLKAVSSINFTKAQNALNKLGSMFGESKADWIEVDFSSWSGSCHENELFTKIKSAIFSNNLVSFNYSNSKGEHLARIIEPLKLCFKGGSWYLYGFCRLRQDFRFFKLHRIKEFYVLDETFLPRAVGTVLEKTNYNNAEPINLKLKISKNASYRVYDEFENYEQLSDGSFIVNTEFPNNEWLFYYIASFGSNCEILEPAYIRNFVIDEFNRILKNYL